jgi:hypothetical protein
VIPIGWYSHFDFDIKVWGISFSIRYVFRWNDFYSHFELGPFNYTLNYTHEFEW